MTVGDSAVKVEPASPATGSGGEAGGGGSTTGGEGATEPDGDRTSSQHEVHQPSG